MICRRCYGNKKYVGNGYVEHSCELCAENSTAPAILDKQAETALSQALMRQYQPTLEHEGAQTQSQKKRGRPKRSG